MKILFILICLAIAYRQLLRWVRQNPEVAAAFVSRFGRRSKA